MASSESSSPSSPPHRFELPAYLFKEGTNRFAYDFLGAHPARRGNQKGWDFVVWAPRAESVSLVGDFNHWEPGICPMVRIFKDFWYVFSSLPQEYDLYKFAVRQENGKTVLKSDPFAFHAETRPGTASKLYRLTGFRWGDSAWYRYKKKNPVHTSPMNIFEVHLGSWRTYEDGSPFSYQKLAEELIPYAKSMGYTHLELLPIGEYPFDDSWGYQVTGFYAPTSRYGEPKDFMYFINEAHKAGMGVILDWVGAHFPKDEFGLYEFDGTRLFEYADPRMAEHPEWTTRVFDLGKSEVRSFLISNVLFWLKKYHLDGIRVDAVSSMLYLDYARKPGEWTPNPDGSNHNLPAVTFLQLLNRAVHEECPDAITVAEESTAWQGITADSQDQGLGFDFKWNMGWMHDTLDYMKLDPLFRKEHHEKLTFSLAYAFNEHFILPLSHDEVVHGKLSLINKMSGLYEDKFAHMRLLFAYMMSHPGKKLSFMGNEIAQFIEWAPAKGLDYFLLDYPSHHGFHDYIRDLNFLYLEEKALWQQDDGWQGFQWIEPDDRNASVISFRRIAKSIQGKTSSQDEVICVLNFTPVDRSGYRLGVPSYGDYKVILSSDETKYGGRGTSFPIMEAMAEPLHRLPYSIELTLPPLSALFVKAEPGPVQQKNISQSLQKKEV